MRAVFASAFKETVALAVLGCLIGGVCGGVTAPGAAASDQTHLVSVNRASKGDQLPVIPTSTTELKSSSLTAMSPAPLKRPPLGCDPAFSSIADPIHAQVYKRCAA
jgi:hypothetical protein